MAKGNLFLGFGRGAVGDAVFYRANGEQITRARNRSPKNSRTPLQLVQRVILKTVSNAYSLLQPLADHSYQGRQEGTPNQSEFSRLNIAMLREQLADVINSGDPEAIVGSAAANFAAKGSRLAEINPYIISQGTLPTVPVSYLIGPGFGVPIAGATSEALPSYADVASALGLQQGDQLTFVALTANDSDAEGANSQYTSLHYARVLLDPAGGDMSVPFGNDPNQRNEGVVTFSAQDGVLLFMLAGTSPSTDQANTVAAAAIIASRLSGGVWQRSTQRLVVRPADAFSFDQFAHFLGDAVWSFMDSTQSSLYLNASRSFTPGA